MFKLNTLAGAIALALVLPNTAFAEFEVSGEAKVEYGLFTTDGTVNGGTEAHEKGDTMKSEKTLKLFINSDVGEESEFHAEVLLANDGEAASDRLQGGEPGGQYEVLREFYFDTSASDWFFRLGKQQVVWGTADGIKLLDFINPTDFRELNQNASEDSRIPIWMINAEKDLDNGANIQIILSESKANFISGLGEKGAEDAGAPFLFKGVDTINGSVNGFTSIANDMGKTSGVFQTLLSMGGLTSLKAGPMNWTTVSQFTNLGTGGANLTFAQVGQGLTAPANIDLNGDGVNETFRNVNLADGTTNPDNTVPGVAGTAFQFAGPINSDPNAALLSVVFLPFMNQLQTGNEVLNQAANNAGGLLNNFAGYLGQLQGGLAAGVADGDPYTNTATAVLDVTGDGFANTTNIQTALGDLFGQMQTGVFGGLTAAGVDTTVDAEVAGALSAATGSTVTETDVANVTPTYQGAIQTAAIAGLSSTFFSNSTTNQFTGTLNTANPTSAFDYMGNTTFGTFDAFIGMSTEYRNMHAKKSNQNLGFRYKDSTDSGMNYTLNFAYRYDSNPYVDMSWEDSAGNTLSVNKNVTSMDALGQPRLDMNGDGVIDNPNTEAYSVTTLNLLNPNGSTFDSKGGANPAKLVFEEKLKQITTLGFSFDSAIDTSASAIILRGEFSYDIGVMQPVVNLDELAIGNLTEALTMQETDMFKYVLGVDVTVLSNMLVSTQLIQMYNLNYKDGNTVYTGDFTSMSLTNGLNKGDEVETFVSFFLSKPFGDDGQHRWNNIFISENGGGYWNRFDIEYGINDELVGTFEINRYWGNTNTTFGQFEKSSNLQLGLKYLF